MAQKRKPQRSGKTREMERRCTAYNGPECCSPTTHNSLPQPKLRRSQFQRFWRSLQTIDATWAAAEGLKWFNWLYLTVTQAVENRGAGGFNDSRWLAQLDVPFAALHFSALHAALSGAPCPGSWEAMFSRRDQAEIARIQFALVGMNAHINHDLPLAIVAACKGTNTVPQRIRQQSPPGARPLIFSARWLSCRQIERSTEA